MTLSVFSFLAAIMIGCLSAFLAHRRGRNPYTWFFVGFFFGILGTLIIFFKSNEKNKLKKEPERLLIQTQPNQLWYYLDTEHKQIGPMSYNAFYRTWKEGKISNETYVWNENLHNWTPLKELTTNSP